MVCWGGGGSGWGIRLTALDLVVAGPSCEGIRLEGQGQPGHREAGTPGPGPGISQQTATGASAAVPGQGGSEFCTRRLRRCGPACRAG